MRRSIVSFIISLTLFAGMFIWYGDMAHANSLVVSSYSFDKEQRILQINGISGSNSGQLVTIAGFNISNGEIITEESEPAFAYAQTTKKLGNYCFNFLVPSDCISGKYRVYISSSEGSNTIDVVISNILALDELLHLINNAGNALKLRDELTKGIWDFGIDMAVYQGVSDDIGQILFNLRPDGGYSSSTDFMKHLSSALAYVFIKRGESFEQVINTYGDAMGIDYQKEFSMCPPEVILKTVEIIKKESSYSRSLHETLKEYRVMAVVALASGWGDLKLALLGETSNGEKSSDNFEVLNADLTYYNLLKKANKENLVFQKLYAEINEVDSIQGLRLLFESIAENIYKKQKENMDSTGGNAGGNGREDSPSVNVISKADTGTVDKKPVLSDMFGHWAQAQVTVLSDKGILCGYEDGTFRPDNIVSRAEFLKILVKSFEVKPHSVVHFSDVSQDDWFAEFVSAAAGANIAKGMENGEFRPNDNLSREDAAVMIYRCLLQYSGIEEATEEELSFYDKDNISEYARNAIAVLSGKGIIKGMDGNRFEPAGITTRAQAAVIICNAKDYIASR